MTIPLSIVDAFTTSVFGGNPATVIVTAPARPPNSYRGFRPKRRHYRGPGHRFGTLYTHPVLVGAARKNRIVCPPAFRPRRRTVLQRLRSAGTRCCFREGEIVV